MCCSELGERCGSSPIIPYEMRTEAKQALNKRIRLSNLSVDRSIDAAVCMTAARSSPRAPGAPSHTGGRRTRPTRVGRVRASIRRRWRPAFGRISGGPLEKPSLDRPTRLGGSRSQSGRRRRSFRTPRRARARPPGRDESVTDERRLNPVSPGIRLMCRQLAEVGRD